MSRNARFVAAAKGLLAVQVAGCVGAAGVTAWAAFEVRDMVRERDALAARVAQLEAVIPPQSLPPPPTAIENRAPPPPADEAEPPVENELVVNKVGSGPIGPPPPTTVPCELLVEPRGMSECALPIVPDAHGACRDVRGRPAVCPGQPPPPPTGPCRLQDAARSPSRCVLPIVPDDAGTCRDVEGRRAICPDPPDPDRACRRVDGRAVVCVPPFTRTPVPGVCVDGRARPVRCPPNTPIRDAPRKTDEQQQSPTRR
jgi:hypothetical protein